MSEQKSIYVGGSVVEINRGKRTITFDLTPQPFFGDEYKKWVDSVIQKLMVQQLGGGDITIVDLKLAFIEKQ